MRNIIIALTIILLSSCIEQNKCDVSQKTPKIYTIEVMYTDNIIDTLIYQSRDSLDVVFILKNKEVGFFSDKPTTPYVEAVFNNGWRSEVVATNIKRFKLIQ